MVELQSWQMEDVMFLREFINETMGIPLRIWRTFYPENLFSLSARIRFYQDADPTRFLFRKIVQHGRLCGYIQCEKTDRAAAEIGYWVHEAYRNQGIMTQAVAQLLADVFVKLDVVRVYARVALDNKASQAVLRHHHFQEIQLEDRCIFTRYR